MSRALPGGLAGGVLWSKQVVLRVDVAKIGVRAGPGLFFVEVPRSICGLNLLTRHQVAAWARLARAWSVRRFSMSGRLFLSFGVGRFDASRPLTETQ